jgi:hypothetical protein
MHKGGAMKSGATGDIILAVQKSAEVAVKRIHKRIYFIRLGKGGGPIVKINQIFHKRISSVGLALEYSGRATS